MEIDSKTYMHVIGLQEMTFSNLQPRWQQYETLKLCPTNYTHTEPVKSTLVQALRLCTGRTAHRGSRGIALLFHDHGTRRGWGVSITPRPLFTPGEDPVPIVQEAGWNPGPVWTGAENLAPIGIRSSVRPARSQSLYRLSYPAHTQNLYCSNIRHISKINWHRYTIRVNAGADLR